jgi:hypothetical protein
MRVLNSFAQLQLTLPCTRPCLVRKVAGPSSFLQIICMQSRQGGAKPPDYNRAPDIDAVVPRARVEVDPFACRDEEGPHILGQGRGLTHFELQWR